MTNKQWLLEKMQNMSDEELAKFLNGSEEFCNIINPKDDCYSEGGGCPNCKINWLKSEHKEQIKLSDAERVILENIDKDYKWIVRNKYNKLWLHKKKPQKDEDDWSNGIVDWLAINMFPNLFQFIKWEDTEPYNIEELLK